MKRRIKPQTQHETLLKSGMGILIVFVLLFLGVSCGIADEPGGDVLLEKIILVSPERRVGDQFGQSVALDQNHLVVGVSLKAGGNNDSLKQAGLVYIFNRTTTDIWDEDIVKLVSPEPEELGQFGHSVSIDGNYLIVGAPSEGEGSNPSLPKAGAAYIFHKAKNGVWDSGTKIVSSDLEAYDNFGISVSISGDFAIVGANHENGGTIRPTGAAYIFHKDDNGIWDSGTKIVASDADEGDQFGSAVSISGDYAVVGAPYENGDPADPIIDTGSIYIFHRTGPDTWDSGIKIPENDPPPERDLPDPKVFHHFGWAVSISGDYVVVGAAPDPELGPAYIFRRTNTNAWDDMARIFAPDAQDGDLFGHSVSISGDRAIVGAYLEEGGAGDPLIQSGSGYIFKRSGLNVWDSVKKIRASDSQEGDRFGWAVSITKTDAVASALGSVLRQNNAGAVYLY